MTARLEFSCFESGLADLYRVPVLIRGREDAILVDGGFTLSNGRHLVEQIKASLKQLTAVFVTCADPDYYFGLAPIRAAFPRVPVLATPTTVKVIRDTVEHKVDVWRSRLGIDGPQSAEETVIPTPWTENFLRLEGVRIDIHQAAQANRFNLWVESEKAIIGGVQIVAGIHVWMADTPTVAERASWVESLDAMWARQPTIAVAGHKAPGATNGVDAITFTRGYLEAFEYELPKAKDADALIAVMKERYPDLAMDFVLELGAKVCKGETQWP